VRRQTYGHFRSRIASPTLQGRYQVILLGHRGTWLWTTCPGSIPVSASAAQLAVFFSVLGD